MLITVGNRTVSVSVWDGKQALYREPVIALDTETTRIKYGTPTLPALLQVFYPSENHVDLVRARDMSEYMKQLTELNPTSKFVLHNAPFDVKVLGGKSGPMMKVLMEDRIIDTGIRFLLHRLKSPDFNDRWALDYCAQILLGLKVDKDETLRLTFHPDMDLTEGHQRYAAVDAVVTYMLVEAMPDPEPTEKIQLRGLFALHEISDRGMLIDARRWRHCRRLYRKEMREGLKVLNVWGYYPGCEGVNTVFQEIMKSIETNTGLAFPKTPKSKDPDGYPLIAVGDELMEMLGDHPHPFLTAYRLYKHAEKMTSTHLNRSLVHRDMRVHPYFHPLKKTARTGASGPPVQQLPREGPLRSIYVAPPGMALLATDYSQLELCALAEHCYRMHAMYPSQFPPSVMHQLISQGIDLHRWLGRQIMELTGGNDKDGIDYRQLAKS